MTKKKTIPVLLASCLNQDGRQDVGKRMLTNSFVQSCTCTGDLV